MELKPCPFCGDVEMRICDVHGDLFVRCGRCGARTRLTTTQKEAVDAWQQRNTRAERTCKDATSEEHTQAFTCSECGCWVAYDEYWETGIYVQGEGQAVHIHPHYCPNCGAKVVG